jgi:hypothetical protein
VAASGFRLGESFKLAGQGQDLPGHCRWFEALSCAFMLVTGRFGMFGCPAAR